MELGMDKIIPMIDYNKINMTPYEFDKKLVEESEVSLFDYNDNGSIKCLNYFNFGVAASILLTKLGDESRILTE